MKHPAETDEFIKIIKAECGKPKTTLVPNAPWRVRIRQRQHRRCRQDAPEKSVQARWQSLPHRRASSCAWRRCRATRNNLKKADEDYESIVGESLNDEESVGKTLGQIVLTALICGGLAFGYYYKAKRDFRASELAVEAKPMVTAGDRGASRVLLRITRQSSTKSLRHPRQSQGWHSRTPCFGLSARPR